MSDRGWFKADEPLPDGYYWRRCQSEYGPVVVSVHEGGIWPEGLEEPEDDWDYGEWHGPLEAPE